MPTQKARGRMERQAQFQGSEAVESRQRQRRWPVFVEVPV